MSAIEMLVAVIPMLGVLIFVHELGHFLVAKACGVRVLKFSLGFGSPIGFGRYRLRWERGGTEYVIAWFPLGGFVKMLGEELDMVQGLEPEVPDARPGEFLGAKPTWQKLAIDFAGPAMNLALPVLLFVLVLAVGLPRAAAVIGNVEPESPAALAGLLPEDRVVSADGTPTEFWADVDEVIRGRTSGALTLEVERAGATRTLEIPVEARSGLGPFGDVEEIGWIGAGNMRLPALMGIPAADSPGARAGLRSGDLVTHVDGEELESWQQWKSAYAGAPGPTVALRVERALPVDPKAEASARASSDPAETAPTETIEVEVPALGSVEALGTIAAAILVDVVEPDTPAARAGLQAGDIVLAVDGQPIGSFVSFLELVRTSGGRTLALTVARTGETLTLDVTPEMSTVPGPLGIEGMDEDAYRIGTRHVLSLLPGVTAVDREVNPLVSVPRAVAMTVEMTGGFLKGLQKLFTGEVGTDKLVGPIGIAQIARRSLDLGWQTYLQWMVLISINLGVLNLLPIPILDGGQALIHAIEGIRRGPLSLRARELVQSFGFAVLMALMGLAFWNDLSRNWSSFVQWLSGNS